MGAADYFCNHCCGICVQYIDRGGGGGGGLTQKCRTCMGGGCFRDPKHKSNMYTFVQQRGVSIFYPESQKYKWYFCTHIS